MSRVLITGGSGFIGTNLVEHYASNGHEVFNLDNVKPRNLDHMNYWHSVDILDMAALCLLTKKLEPTLVFHLAARTDLNGSDISDYAANIAGVQNVIEALKQIETVQFVVFASSMLVCRLGYHPLSDIDYCPDTSYGKSKVMGENIVRGAELNVPWTIVRPTSMWGPWFGVPYRSFFDIIRKGLYVHPLGLRVKRSYGFVYNAVYQLQHIAKMHDDSLVGETIYLADYKPVELKTWAVTIQQALGAGVIREVPYWIFKIGAWIGDVAKQLGFSNPPMSSFRLKNMLTETIHNTDKLKSYCGDTPYSMREGVLITCEWLNHDVQK